MTPTQDLSARFWTKVDKTGSCWLWTGATTRRGDGYGQIRVGGRLQLAHRVAYELVVGPIPEGMDVDHLCRVRLCVHPLHLEPVPPLENWRRGINFSARNSRKTHCHRGHPLSGDNLRIVNGGRSRRCLQCKRDSANAINARRRGDAVVQP